MSTLTTNFGLNKDGENDWYDVAKVNQNTDTIDEVLGNVAKFEKAGGIATAITLTGISLVDGRSKTFIVKANNNAVATTINGKPLYKSNTTTAPKLKANTAVVVWYDAAGDCFFIKASASGGGTVVVGDVLAGKTFVNEDGDEIEGTIPNLAGSQNVYVGGTDKYVDIKRHTDNAHARITVKPGFKGYFNENTTMDLYVWNLLVENVKAGIPFGGTDHLMTGTFTADATAIDSDVLSGKTYYRNGVKGTGNIITVLPDNLDHLNERAAPTVGKFSTDNPNTNYAYLNVGSGNYYKKDIAWVRSAQPDLLPENIRSGKNVLGVAGTMVRGKGYAAGTKFVNVSANTYICTNGDYGAGYPMTVSGLSLPFTPSIIIIRLDDHGAAHGETLYINIGAHMYGPLVMMSGYTNQLGAYNNTLYFKGNVAPCYVTTDGFSLPVLQNGYTYTWIAIE